MNRLYKKSTPILDGPILDRIKVTFGQNIDTNEYPFSLPLIQNLQEIEFPAQVTFFVGENGAGKSTILEAIANKAGFGAEGGSKNFSFKTSQEKFYTSAQQLADCFTLSWRQKPRDGYFFRAESFFNVANYVDEIAQSDQRMYDAYGGKSLHEQSHGEGFLSFFKNRMGNGGFYILDEPEAAFSPQRQLSLLAMIHDLCKNSHAQFIIATHSPLLLAYPNATIYSCDGTILKTIAYTETEHYQITKRFLDNPEKYLQYLFEE